MRKLMPDLTPQHDFLVAIDSDGCAFDTMELKHKECFAPHLINTYNLQAISKYARETWEYFNLYSKGRGTNRFPAVVKTMEWLLIRPEVLARGAKITIPQGLAKWVKEETRLGNPALKLAVEKTGDPDLKQALAWSLAVNDQIERFVRGVPPFPYVRECLEQLAGKVDMLVCSATPGEALVREWQEHRIDGFVAAICGQEVGSKKEILAVAKKYKQQHVLMVGDAPGDQLAAQANSALFFPIMPGKEDQSWRRLYEEGIDRFFNGTFAGEYQNRLNDEFDKALPIAPPWPTL
jgi:phosphoglycolate phosphatase-like HAD superfamily hydrolase